MTAKPPSAETRSPKELRAHSEAARIPSMAAIEAKALHADVAEHGIQVPLDINARGVVLDGRQRHRVALALGLDEVPVRIVAPADEVEFMFRMALIRRNLTASQRALLVLEWAEYRAARAEAQLRKQANLRNSRLDAAALPHRGRSRALAAERAGVSERTIQDALKVREHGDAALEQLVRTGGMSVEKAVREIKRRERYAQIGPSPPFPTGTYDVIAADPAWQMGNAGSPWSPEQHYLTMPTVEIAALKVPAAINAILFLFMVSSLLRDGLDVAEAWGFIPKTTMVWDKAWIGPGNYLRNRHELVLIATRGTYPFPAPEDRPDSIFREQRTGHSVKPQLFYELIERMYPNATRLEMFARGKTRPGWTSWGNQVID